MQRARAILLVVLDGAGPEGRTFREFWFTDLRADAPAAQGVDAVDLDAEGRPSDEPAHPTDWIEAVPRGSPEKRRSPSPDAGVLVTDGPAAELLAQEFLEGFDDAGPLLAAQRDLDALRAGASEGWSRDRREAVAHAQRGLNAAVRASRFRWPVVLTILGAREHAVEMDFRSLNLERGILIEAVHGSPVVRLP